MDYGSREPRIVLLSLADQRTLGYPRFALAVSFLASALRARTSACVEVHDMQLVEPSGLIRRVLATKPDIVGLSATYGQFELLDQTLGALQDADPEGLLVIAGGSLPARIPYWIVEKYPHVAVATGAGETTLIDVVRALGSGGLAGPVRGLLYRSRSGDIVEAPVESEANDLFPPGLELVDETLAAGGALTIETSRGCWNSCSFCPRDHKGHWHRLPWVSGSLAGILEKMGAACDAHHAPRRVFIVDEEFIGLDSPPGLIGAAQSIATELQDAGFGFDVFSRIDQVYRPAEDSDAAAARIGMWRYLRSCGLRRALFGAESGVPSILERFRKRISSRQIVVALRAITLAGVPIRVTYITFDPVMTFEELKESHQFLGRTDILMTGMPEMSDEAVAEIAQDDSRASALALGIPVYREITYALVPMECLQGSDYLDLVCDHGVRGVEDPALGRVEVPYRDFRVGAIEAGARRWNSRHYALDYALKSLEKKCEDRQAARIRELRTVLKDRSYDLLGRWLSVAQDACCSDDALHAVMKTEAAAATEYATSMRPAFASLLREVASSDKASLSRVLAAWEALCFDGKAGR